MVATGDEGKIFRVTAPGQGSVYYETGQAHVTSLAFDAQGRLLAGCEPNGILYRVTAAGQGVRVVQIQLAGDSRHRDRLRMEQSTRRRWAAAWRAG